MGIRRTKKRKGYFFSFDAIVAVSILFVVIMLATSFYISENQNINLNFYAQDVLRVLSELNVSEVNSTFLTTLKENNTITRLDNTMLEQIGELWAERELGHVENILEEFLGVLIDERFSYSFHIDDEEILKKEDTTPSFLTAAQKLVSGIQKNRTREGFIARVTATKVRKNITEVFVFHPQGSEHGPGSGGRLVVTKKINLPAVSFTSGTISLSVHSGKQLNSQSKFRVNGNEISPNWIYEAEDTPQGGGTKVSFGTADITSLLQTGWNEIEIEVFGQPGFHTHLHPGGMVVINYDTETNFEINQTINRRIYFDNTLSKASNKEHGAWQIVPFHVPQDATVQNVTIHIVGKDIDNIANKDNIQLYLNNNVLDLTDPPCNVGQTCDFDKTYNPDLGLVSSNTNVISLYFNALPDDFWSKKGSNVEIYADPQNNSNGSSYVDVSYTFNAGSNKLQYGKIDVALAVPFQGPDAFTNYVLENLSGMNIYEAFVRLATLDTTNNTIIANEQLVFRTIRPLATPSTVYIDNEFLLDSMNTINATDDCSTCEHHYVLDKSLLHYTAYVPSIVGYGTTFDTQQTAIDDAVERLEILLGPHIDTVEVNDEVLTLGKVPTLWGPAIFEVRVWQ